MNFRSCIHRRKRRSWQKTISFGLLSRAVAELIPRRPRHKNPRAKIPLLWWWPDDEAYTGKWVPWLDGNAQSKSTEFRGALLVVDVQVKNAVYSPRTRLRDQKAHLTAASLRMIPSAQQYFNSAIHFAASFLSSSFFAFNL